LKETFYKSRVFFICIKNIYASLLLIGILILSQCSTQHAP